MIAQTKKIIHHLKKEKPLILNITNHVTMDFIANGLLSLGASPIMSLAEEEINDLITHAHVIVINIGTLNEAFVSLCHHVFKIANQLKKPIVFDPVGVGASGYRTKTALSFIEQYHIAIIRGNASEIMALSDQNQKTKGVDSIIKTNDAVQSALILSKQINTAIVISGKVDMIIDQDQLEENHYGSSLMPTITGMGCLLSSVIAAFHAIEKDRFKAAAIATSFYGFSGNQAEKEAKGPGSFRTYFLDALHTLDHYP